MQSGIVAPGRGSGATASRHEFGQRLSLLRGQISQPQEHGIGHVPLRGIPARRQRHDILPGGAARAQAVLEKLGDLSR